MADYHCPYYALTVSAGGRARVLTWVSVSIRLVATSKRLGRVRYLFVLNWFSSSSSCWLVKAVRGRRALSSTLAPGGVVAGSGAVLVSSGLGSLGRLAGFEGGAGGGGKGSARMGGARWNEIKAEQIIASDGNWIIYRHWPPPNEARATSAPPGLFAYAGRRIINK